MIGYRSVGYDEIKFLLNSENPVYGRFKYSSLAESGCTLPYGVISFYTDNYKWHDSSHKVDIKVNLPDDAQIGVATYYAAPNFGDTKIFTGRKGSIEYKVKEAYVRCYEPKDIIEINLNGLFASHYIESAVKPFCEKYGIKLIWENKVIC